MIFISKHFLWSTFSAIVSVYHTFHVIQNRLFCSTKMRTGLFQTACCSFLWTNYQIDNLSMTQSSSLHSAPAHLWRLVLKRSVSWLITLRLLWLVGCITDVSSDDLAMGKKMWQTWRLLESDSYHWYTILVFSVILNTILFLYFPFLFSF